jgi:hypothetical protein
VPPPATLPAADALSSVPYTTTVHEITRCRCTTSLPSCCLLCAMPDYTCSCCLFSVTLALQLCLLLSPCCLCMVPQPCMKPLTATFCPPLQPRCLPCAMPCCSACSCRPVFWARCLKFVLTHSPQAHNPTAATLPTTNGPWATGDSLDIAQRAGARLIDLSEVQIHPTGVLGCVRVCMYVCVCMCVS